MFVPCRRLSRSTVPLDESRCEAEIRMYAPIAKSELAFEAMIKDGRVLMGFAFLISTAILIVAFVWNVLRVALTITWH